MKETVSLRRLLLGGLGLALGVYVVGFALDQHWRTRRGPWEVVFEATAAGEPRLRVRQKHLRLPEVVVVFEGERWTNGPVTARFDAPLASVPFGRVKYHDLTYLPGVVTLEVYGHELELLPRVLYVNRRPVAWVSATNLVLRAKDHPAQWPNPQQRR